MSRRGIAAVVTLLTVAIALSYLSSLPRRRPEPRDAVPVAAFTSPSTQAAVERLSSIPWYRAALRPEAVLGGLVDPDGTVHIRVDPRALLASRSESSAAALRSLLPAVAHGTIVLGDEIRETWLLEGPSPLLDLLDRKHPVGSLELAQEAIPPGPTALVTARLAPARLAAPGFGGPPLAVWRQRLDLAERMFGRSVRAELAEDLAGPLVFAVYDHEGGTGADALLALALNRSDRIRSLLDAAFALGTLTNRASVHRYRDVPIGAFAPGSAGHGLALGVDGRVLFVASSASRLEAAIDARRSGVREPDGNAEAGAQASWTARATSTFVAHGWSRLARAPDPPRTSPRRMWAELTPEGASSWRLEGHGPDPAITADPVLPFLRSVLARRQRGDG